MAKIMGYQRMGAISKFVNWIWVCLEIALNNRFSFSVCRSVEAAADRRYSYVILTTKAIPEGTKTCHIVAPFLSSKYNEHFPQPVYVKSTCSFSIASMWRSFCILLLKLCSGMIHELSVPLHGLEQIFERLMWWSIAIQWVLNLSRLEYVWLKIG